MTFVKSVDFPTSLSENLDGSISLFLLWIMWQIIGFELSRLWEYCESVEVRGRRLKNTSFRFSCQLHFSKHSFSWITSNHKPSKWTPLGYNSGGLEVVVLLSVFALWQSLLSCPFSLGGIPQTPSDHTIWKAAEWEFGAQCPLLCNTAFLPIWDKPFPHSPASLCSMNWAHVCCGTLVEQWRNMLWGELLVSSFLKCRGIFNALKFHKFAHLPFLA